MDIDNLSCCSTVTIVNINYDILRILRTYT